LQALFSGVHEGDTCFHLRISAEPKIQVTQVLNVVIDKAIDDLDQKLVQSGADAAEVAVPAGGFARPGAVMMAPAFFPGVTTQYLVMLKSGEKPSNLLKEVSGKATLSILPPAKDLIVVDDILKAGGKTVKGKDGGHVKITEATKDESGQIKVRLEL